MLKLFTNKKPKKKERMGRSNVGNFGGKLGPQNGIVLGFWEESGPQNGAMLGF
jgi:hypothetical protein